MRNDLNVAKEINKIFKILGDKDVDLITRALRKKFPHFFVVKDPNETVVEGLLFYKAYGYRNIDDFGNSYWRIVDSPYDIYIGEEFSTEKKLKDYIDKQV